MAGDLDLHKYDYASPFTGVFLPRIDFSNPSPLGNVFRISVSKPNQFSHSLDVDVRCITVLK